jgi:hypothetical protein
MTIYTKKKLCGIFLLSIAIALAPDKRTGFAMLFLLVGNWVFCDDDHVDAHAHDE